jgi:hypothetical protein
MVASLLITIVSVALLAYWFRYTCLLILRKHRQPERIHRASVANGLHLPALEHDLYSAQPLQSDLLERALENDFQILSFLLAHASDLGVSALERNLLALDFRLMRVWYRLVRLVSPSAARQALVEMVAILNHMAGAVGGAAAGR